MLLPLMPALVSERYLCCSEAILQTELAVHLSVDVDDVDAINRFQHGRGVKAFPSLSTVHEYVSITGLDEHAFTLLSFPVWPANLVACALLNTLHSQVYSGYGRYWGISRERFFFYGFSAAALYCMMPSCQVCARLMLTACTDILPGYLFTALSTFSWVSCALFWRYQSRG